MKTEAFVPPPIIGSKHKPTSPQPQLYKKTTAKSSTCFVATSFVAWSSPSDNNNNNDNSNKNNDDSDNDNWQGNDWTIPPSLSGLSGGATANANTNTNGPEKSQMINFISDFLRNSKSSSNDKKDSIANQQNQDNDEPPPQQQDNTIKYTHLIAIPMGSCHELAIELESVQRAILYHCPVLVHACLVPATTRLPLLYVHQTSGGTLQQGTQLLHDLVHDVIQRHVNVPVVVDNDTTIADNNNRQNNDVNEAGIRPLTLTFQSLEIDGANNNVLHTVALPDDPGTRRLQELVAELRRTIDQRLHWETALPPDPHLVVDDQATSSVFRPRLPFMRIPPNFQDYLDPLVEPDNNKDENENQQEDQQELFRTSDQGGNGISPIFWASWWEDEFGTSRLPEIGIYPRTPLSTTLTTPQSDYFSALSEAAFYLAQRSIALPDGTAAMNRQEAKFEEYQNQRMKQAEYDAQQDMEEQRQGLVANNDSRGGGDKNNDNIDDLMLDKTRARLESLYQQPLIEDTNINSISAKEKDRKRPKVDTTLLDDWTRERIRKANAAKGLTMYDDNEDDDDDDDVDVDVDVDNASSKNIKDSMQDGGNAQDNSDRIVASGGGSSGVKDSNQLDDWTRQRIRKTIASRQVVQTQKKLATKKNKVPIQDNPIFQKFKQGTLVPESEKQQYAAPSSSSKELEPFPSREQFVGFWQVMTSPTGFPLENNSDESMSENLVLRVDGTTAAGPILDPVTNQKAAGGTWKVIPNDDNDGRESAQLRIRLVIPPKKERILVMEGTATKRSMVSLQDLPPMARSTFGVPELETKISQAKAAGDKVLSDLNEEKIFCKGKVWLEDAITRKNKVDIGTFSLMKLNTPRDPTQYTITIPRPIRNQD